MKMAQFRNFHSQRAQELLAGAVGCAQILRGAARASDPPRSPGCKVFLYVGPYPAKLRVVVAGCIFMHL